MKTINVSVANKSTVPFGDVGAIVAAVQKQSQNEFAKFWQVQGISVVLDELVDDGPSIIFFDTADQAGALGYHDVSPNGFPYGKVFVKTSMQDGETVSSVFSHEYLELLADPMADQIALNPANDYQYALEDCDAVETESYKIDGIEVSNFVTPSWFDPKAPAGTQFDFLGNVKQAFHIDPGGYMPVKIGGNWTQIFGSEEAKARYNRKAHNRVPMILRRNLPFAKLRLFDPTQFPRFNREQATT
jgi:hypothetical protein